MMQTFTPGDDIRRARNALALARHDLSLASQRGDAERVAVVRQTVLDLQRRVEELESKQA